MLTLAATFGPGPHNSSTSQRRQAQLNLHYLLLFPHWPAEPVPRACHRCCPAAIRIRLGQAAPAAAPMHAPAAVTMLGIAPPMATVWAVANALPATTLPIPACIDVSRLQSSLQGRAFGCRIICRSVVGGTYQLQARQR